MKERQYFFCNNLFFLYFQNQTLELAALSPSIESLNEASIKLPLSDFTMKKMQNLTRQWSQKTAAALECCRSERQTKKSLVTISFSVRKLKTKLKYWKSYSLFSAFSGACQVEFCPFSLIFQWLLVFQVTWSKILDVHRERREQSAKWNPHYVNVINHHIRPSVNIPRKTIITTVSGYLFCFTVCLRELKMMRRNSFRNVRSGWNS